MVDIVNRDSLKITETLCETLSQLTLWPGATRADLPSVTAKTRLRYRMRKARSPTLAIRGSAFGLRALWHAM